MRQVKRKRSAREMTIEQIKSELERLYDEADRLTETANGEAEYNAADGRRVAYGIALEYIDKLKQ
jgi:hypothetical protein